MPPEGLVLGFDTSAAHCAAALLRGGAVLSERLEPMAKGQAERLMVMLEEMLAEVGLGWRDLDVIGVGTGPGNFTGVRISVAAARGLALSLGIPAIGVSVLEAQAYGLSGTVVSVADARRGMVYAWLNQGGTEPLLCAIDQMPGLPPKSEPVCVGDIADKVAAHCGWQVVQPKQALATAIAQLAAKRRFSAHTRPLPLYIRPPDAAPARDTAPVILP